MNLSGGEESRLQEALFSGEGTMCCANYCALFKICSQIKTHRGRGSNGAQGTHCCALGVCKYPHLVQRCYVFVPTVLCPRGRSCSRMVAMRVGGRMENRDCALTGAGWHEPAQAQGDERALHWALPSSPDQARQEESGNQELATHCQRQTSL